MGLPCLTRASQWEHFVPVRKQLDWLPGGFWAPSRVPVEPQAHLSQMQGLSAVTCGLSPPLEWAPRKGKQLPSAGELPEGPQCSSAMAFRIIES